MKFNKSFSLIHGYLCADGYVTRNLPHQKHKYYSIGLRNTNLVLLKDFQDNFEQVFKVKPFLVPGQRCRINSKAIYYKLMENGPYHSNNWKYPSLSKENARFWLRAFFDCEGWIEVNKRKTRCICAESINRDQLPKILKVLVRFKIRSKIYLHKNRKTSRLAILDRNSIIQFEKWIGFLHPAKKQKLKEAIGSFTDYVWNLPKKDIICFIRDKVKIKKPYNIRIFSVKMVNLKWLSDILLNRFHIESKIYKDKNGYGSIYYYLSIHRKNEVKKMVEKGLLNPSDVEKIKKNILNR